MEGCYSGIPYCGYPKHPGIDPVCKAANKGGATLPSLTAVKTDICQPIELIIIAFGLYILRMRERSKNHYLLPTL